MERALVHRGGPTIYWQAPPPSKERRLYFSLLFIDLLSCSLGWYLLACTGWRLQAPLALEFTRQRLFAYRFELKSSTRPSAATSKIFDPNFNTSERLLMNEVSL
jgi:hypothetical protein